MSEEIKMSSTSILEEEITVLKTKRKQLKDDISFLKSSFEGGLDSDSMVYENILLEVVRVLNERLHHTYLYFCSDNEGYEWFEYNGGKIVYNGAVIYGIDEVDTFASVYKVCVDNIIDAEGDESIKGFMASLYFIGDETNDVEEIFNKIKLAGNK